MKSREVCEHLRISRATLQNWIKDGRIKAVRIAGRKRARLLFRRSEVEALLREQRPSDAGGALTAGQKLLQVRGYLSKVEGVDDEFIDGMMKEAYDRRREPIQMRLPESGDVPA